MDYRRDGGAFLLGDCFDRMREIPDDSVDMILCDLPYGTTQNAWDSVLPLDKLWAEYWRVAKPNAAVVLTAATAFNITVGASQLARLKYDWIWEKTAATGFLNAHIEPLRAHEHVLVFGRGPVTYNPQKTTGHARKVVARDKGHNGATYGAIGAMRPAYDSTERFPRSVLTLAKDNRLGSPHSAQKPVALFEYLIRTYTNPGDLVLDNTAGSGTTAIAALNAGRRWICIERDENYYWQAVARVMEHRV